MLARITPPTRSRALDHLRWMDAKTIASLIEHEHPQIAALVLAILERRSPPTCCNCCRGVQPDLIYRVAKLGPVTETAEANSKSC